MSEFELIEAWYLGGQSLANSFVSSSTVIFAYIVVAHFIGKSLDSKIAIALTALYSLFLVGALGSRVPALAQLYAVALEYSQRYPDGVGLIEHPPLNLLYMVGLMPFVLAWIASICYLHFHIRKQTNSS